MYPIKRASRSEFIPVRHLTYHVRIWGDARPGVPPLVMVHGWMDVAASYQFVVDALSDAFAQGRQIIAPDWRGYGQTALPGTDNYWFPDYLADLDTLLDHYAPEQPVDLVGHSMGGNVVMLYAGVRPQRIRRLINLEGFGMPATRPSQAPGRLAKWMDDLKALHRGELDLKAYDDAAGVARRLMKTNPRLGQDRAEWLAREWAAPRVQPDGTTSGKSRATRPTRSSTPTCTGSTRCWKSTAASPRRHWRWRPPTTAWASGGRASTRWTSTTSA
jgi:pimeloyl-ACP methyl ester carboxylesterase